MALAAITNDKHLSASQYDIIVIGSGPVGIRVIQEINKFDKVLSIAVFGDEPWQPYNRVKLSSLLTGDSSEESLYASYDLSEYSGVSTFYNNRIIDIDRYSKVVIDSQGNKYCYTKLILATGSRPFIPNMPGINLKNIFTLRNLSDAQKLMSRSVSTRKTVIIGGGLLGLEAARAMQRFNTEVHIIEHSMWLMFRQLDNRAGRYLEYHIESLDIKVHLSERVKSIAGDTKVTGVILSNGETIECDTVVIAAGIVPNSQLAIDAGLHVGKGIRVDDHMQTRDKDIYAIGECAEHRNRVYGLVAPGLEQAAVLAHHLNGEATQYSGSTSSSSLKVLDYHVFSVGNTGVDARERESIIFQNHGEEIYRKIVVINGRIRGAVGIGKWPGSHRIKEAVEKQRRLWPWQINRFKKHGLLWNDSTLENVIEWPASATVCNCTGVTRGQLDSAMKRGACTVVELSNATGAASVCGSCKNLLTDFIGSNTPPDPVIGFKILVGASLISIFAALIIFFLPSPGYAPGVQTDFNIDVLWRDSLFKQISGFSLLGLSVLISILSARKRIRKLLKLWDFSYWRLAHVVLGALIIAVLFIHTGFRLGENLNFYLMLVFSSLLLVGSIAGFTIGYEHNLSTGLAKKLRAYSIWSHIILLWPLPALLGFHILKTYYF